ncbi:MAG: hypothetical protein A4E19_02105 [Nitrospira sp. SG-bin1]|nr:MAG: hypothetical protein A4E19_02105 [Nitrospira sp. SG-bin1]
MIIERRQQASVDESSLDSSSEQCVKILWTGGWDSTFRVLYVTLVEGKRIEPHYVIHTDRPSSLRELQAISEIKDLLRISDKKAFERISSLHITTANEIPEDEEITSSWKRLKQRAHLGSQYDWLARYAKSKHLTDLELSVHIDDKAYSFLKGNVEQTPLGSYRLKEHVTGDENIFTRFAFPILEYSKTEMRDIARQCGFLEILEKSWFCHEPRHGVPCGMCKPCIYTIEEGMSYRFPRESLFRFHARRYGKAIRDAIRTPFRSARKSLSKVKALRPT